MFHFLQVVVIIITLAFFGVNLYGTTQLEQYFDQNWVLPPDSMTYKYTLASSEVKFLHFFSVFPFVSFQYIYMSMSVCLFVYFTLTLNASCKLFAKNFAEAHMRLGSCSDIWYYLCNIAVFSSTWGPSGNIHRWDKR